MEAEGDEPTSRVFDGLAGEALETRSVPFGNGLGVSGLALANWLADAGVLAASITAVGAAVPWQALLLVYGSGASLEALASRPEDSGPWKEPCASAWGRRTARRPGPGVGPPLSVGQPLAGGGRGVGRPARSAPSAEHRCRQRGCRFFCNTGGDGTICCRVKVRSLGGAPM